MQSRELTKKNVRKIQILLPFAMICVCLTICYLKPEDKMERECLFLGKEVIITPDIHS